VAKEVQLAAVFLLASVMVWPAGQCCEHWMCSFHCCANMHTVFQEIIQDKRVMLADSAVIAATAAAAGMCLLR
jgi:hypothetical protein